MKAPGAPRQHGALPALVRSLAAHIGEGPPGRTLLVASTRGEGRELLRALARARGAWVGLDVTTPRPLAMEVAGAELAGDGWRLLDDFAEQALLDELLDEALAEDDGSGLQDLAEGVGFRKAVREAVSALRLAGVDAASVRRASFDHPGRRDLLAALIARYERRRQGGVLADTAAVIEAATRALAAGAPLPAERVLLLPGLGTRGLAGRFVRALEARGAGRLAADPVRGLDPPPGVLWEEDAGTAGALGHVHAVDAWLRGGGAPSADHLSVFRAAGVTEELREVLRRVLESGLRWDEVEVVTPDPGAYGPALHGLASRLGVPVTFAVGLPVERTRPGRAVAAWLRWVQEGFPDAVLRGLLEAGDLAPPRRYRDVDGARLARRLRRLRVGWGRERYLPAVRAARERLEAEGPRLRREEDPEEARGRHARELRELEALAALLRPLLDAVPAVPPRGAPEQRPVAPADLARGLARFLDAVPGGGAVDDTAVERLRRILDRAAATLSRPAPFPSALAVLTEHLAIRVPAPRAEGRAPWSSAGGHLHLSDVEHGGLSGRRATYVVGLDAGRFPGAGTQDPILLDAERAALAPRDLPGSAERLAERRFRMAALLARLRGRVTLSWPAWDSAEGRLLTPSSLMLQAYRLVSGRPEASFQDLERHAGEPVTRIPARRPVDAEDVWLGALSRGGRLLAGEVVVRAAYPALDAGLRAREARLGGPSAHHGLVAPRERLDPRRGARPVLSSSRLEALASCPLRYFYRYVLDGAPPADPVFDPERWLDALARGSLLHRVYERLLVAARREGMALDDREGLEARALEVLREAAEEVRRDVPPPSESVHDREMVELARDVASFVGMVAGEPPEWVETELRFGFASAARPAVELGLPGGGRALLGGAVDRVDRLPSGGLRVVDYKTGVVGRFREGGTFNGGRRLQHALYVTAVEALLGEAVHRMEYHFPTRRGENERVRFVQADLAGWPVLLERLAAIPAAGAFLPTEEPQDCRWCDFQRVCRVAGERSGKPVSPLAAWGAEHFEEEAYDLLRAVRLFEARP